MTQENSPTLPPPFRRIRVDLDDTGKFVSRYVPVFTAEQMQACYGEGRKAGAASRQAEIDALRTANLDCVDHFELMRKERDEAVKLLREAAQEGVSRDWLQRIDTFLGSIK